MTAHITRALLSQVLGLGVASTAPSAANADRTVLTALTIGQDGGIDKHCVASMLIQLLLARLKPLLHADHADNPVDASSAAHAGVRIAILRTSNGGHT